MRIVDEIAAQGVQNGAQDGPPVAVATIARVTVPEGALEGTGTYVTATPSDELLPTDELSTDGVDPTAVDPDCSGVPRRRIPRGGADRRR